MVSAYRDKASGLAAYSLGFWAFGSSGSGVRIVRFKGRAVAVRVWEGLVIMLHLMPDGLRA